jgi:Cu/Ag efflux pump CusA
VGGVLAAYVGGGVISLGSLVGFLTVFGIAARNGILLINHYQHLERYEGEAFGLEMALRGARERLSPIVMTALATGLALVPTLMFGNVAGLEIIRPMAVVILGGLITSAVLTLFIVPAFYLSLAIRRADDLELEPALSVAGYVELSPAMAAGHNGLKKTNGPIHAEEGQAVVGGTSV